MASLFMHQQLLCSALEIIINQVLSMDISGQKNLTQLNQQSLSIELDEFTQPFCLHVIDGKLLITCISADKSFTANCTITTSVSTLIELKNEQQLTELIRQEKLDIHGDIKVAQRFSALADSLVIDWPSELEKHLGDIATHKLLSLAKVIKRKAQFAGKQISADATEYLVYEQGLMITNQQIQAFTNQVADVERAQLSLEQRIDTLMANYLTLHSAVTNNAE